MLSALPSTAQHEALYARCGGSQACNARMATSSLYSHMDACMTQPVPRHLACLFLAALWPATVCCLRHPAALLSSTSESSVFGGLRCCPACTASLVSGMEQPSCASATQLRPRGALVTLPCRVRMPPNLGDFDPPCPPSTPCLTRPGTWQFDPVTGTFDRGQMVPLTPVESRRARATQVAKVGSCRMGGRPLGAWGATCACLAHQNDP